MPHWGTSNEYPQCMLSCRNDKGIITLCEKISLSDICVLFLGDKVACMINNLGGMSVLEMNIVAKEALEYLGKLLLLLWWLWSAENALQLRKSWWGLLISDQCPYLARYCSKINDEQLFCVIILWSKLKYFGLIYFVKKKKKCWLLIKGLGFYCWKLIILI